MTNPTLPDFAVFNDQSEGFKEFLKVFSNYRGLKNNPLTGAWKYYGYIRGTLYCYDTEWTTNILTPSQAIQLLTGQPKQLTVEKHPCHECSGTGILIVQGCCNNPTPNGNCCGSAIQVQEQCEACHATGNVILNSQPESVPAKEEVNSEDEKKSIRKYVIELEEQVAHLQQQLKEENEKIEKAIDYIKDSYDFDYDAGQALIDIEKILTNS